MKIAIIDIETTSKYLNCGHIVEIGICELNIMTGQATPLFNSIIKEVENFDSHAWIFQNSTLKPEEVISQGKSLEEVRTQLQTIFDTYICLAYNSPFDFGWLRSRNFTILHTFNDPMFIMQDILKIENQYGYDEYKWPSVQECLNFLHINIREPHRALDDAMLEAKIIWYLFQQGIYTN